MPEALCFHVFRLCVHVCVRASVCPFVWDVVCAISVVFIAGFSANFQQTSCDKDELVWFWGQKVKCQGQSMTRYAKNTIFIFSVISLVWILSDLSLVHLGT